MTFELPGYDERRADYTSYLERMESGPPDEEDDDEDDSDAE